MKEIKTFFRNILEKIYPSDINCMFCGNEVRNNEYCMCDTCAKKVEWNNKYCLRCGSPIYSMANYCIFCKGKKKSFAFARAPLVYADAVTFAVQNYKYNNKRYLAKHFARIMLREYLKMKDEGVTIDIIAYVPLFNSRQKKRGFNQSELLAKELAELTNLPLSRDNLIRIKDTETQTHLTYKERQENLNGAFKITDKTEFDDKNVLLIDDVLTTGSTVNHCAEVLKKAKAKNVYVLTFASTKIE
jgi:ComF family protein